jgi:hypothetical protein
MGASVTAHKNGGVSLFSSSSSEVLLLGINAIRDTPPSVPPISNTPEGASRRKVEAEEEELAAVGWEDRQF